jgi:hypothetical protein
MLSAGSSKGNLNGWVTLFVYLLRLDVRHPAGGCVAPRESFAWGSGGARAVRL